MADLINRKKQLQQTEKDKHTTWVQEEYRKGRDDFELIPTRTITVYNLDVMNLFRAEGFLVVPDTSTYRQVWHISVPFELPEGDTE